MSARNDAFVAIDNLDRARFWSKVDKSSECWIWTGAKDRKGYGVFGVRRIATVATHRLAYFIATGLHPGSLMICHRCDNPSCVRPDHLFAGTLQQNTADKVAKDRQHKGEAHPAHKLTADIVRSIRLRHAAGETQGSIARDVGIGQPTVHRIVFRITWKHVS